MHVELSLFGPPILTVGGDPDGTQRVGAKGLALLAYLALEPGPHPRTELAALLWSDSPQSAARASLRQALRQLRQVGGDAIRVTRSDASLAADVHCDARRFLALVEEDPDAAVTFPVDRFLTGLSLRHADAFEEWADLTRQRLLARFRDALRHTTLSALARSHWRDAIRAAERWRDADPLSDQATRTLMEAHYMAGDRGEALAAYASYRQQLADDLGTDPPAALCDLANRIAAGRGVDHAPRRSDGAIPAQSFDPSLVGREAEWNRLTQLWTNVAGGDGGVALIQGEPGVGKTRLAEDLLQWIAKDGATVLRGQGYDPDLGVAYAPVVDAFRSALDAPGLATAAPEWLAELARIVPDLHQRFPSLPDASSPGDTDRRGRLFESAVQALLALASERPTALFMDDLQRCDGDSCALLHFAAQRLEGAPVLILVTVTQGDVGRNAPASRLCRALRSGTTQATVVTLGPLPEAALWTMIRELGRVSTPDGAKRFAAQVHAVTDGNPFHTIELLKSLFAQGILTVDPESGEWLATEALESDAQRVLMPTTVHDTISARCAGLPYALRDLLVTICVAGRGVDTELLSHIHGMSRLRAATLADELVDRRLLRGKDGVYQAAHPVVQDVVRDDVTPTRRREVHRAIALALDTIGVQDRAGEIARHAERGGEPSLAYRNALEAAERATADGAFDDALSWLDLAASVAESGPQAEAVDERTADVLARTGAPSAPPQDRRIGTPARGFARYDLDLPGKRT